MLKKLSKPFTHLAERYYPDALVFAILLTFVAFILSFIFTDTTVLGAINAWGNGFNSFMTFVGQMSFILLSGTALANTRPAKRALAKAANIPKNAASCYAMTTLITLVFSLVAWSLGLVMGGIYARYVQYQAQKKDIKIHFPLLVAAVYSAGLYGTWA